MNAGVVGIDRTRKADSRRQKVRGREPSLPKRQTKQTLPVLRDGSASSLPPRALQECSVIDDGGAPAPQGVLGHPPTLLGVYMLVFFWKTRASPRPDLHHVASD